MSHDSQAKRTSPISADKIDALVRSAVFAPDEAAREKQQRVIRELAFSLGIVPSSIYGLYQAAGKGLYHGKTVPAINIRGITYDVARAVFRAALKDRVGAFIFEIARSEIGYTGQRPAEYATCVLAAAIREGFRGPLFIQGDHFQVNPTRYAAESDKELNAIRELISESVRAGFLNIDVDASTIVDLDQPTLEKQQEKNYQVMADMTRFIRSIEPSGVTISVGGEIGEVGKKNSTVEELRAFMTGYLGRLGRSVKGISKISVQTGTKHGGVVLPDGSIATVDLDFKTLEEMSKVAREDYGMAGAVQHGASTLPDDAFGLFPKASTAEVHLATGFQNIIYDSPHFSGDLRSVIYKYLVEHHADERAAGDTDEQFFYNARKRAFGPFKKAMWDLPEEERKAIRATLESRFTLLFNRLNVVGTVDLVNKFVPTP